MKLQWVFIENREPEGLQWGWEPRYIAEFLRVCADKIDDKYARDDNQDNAVVIRIDAVEQTLSLRSIYAGPVQENA